MLSSIKKDDKFGSMLNCPSLIPQKLEQDCSQFSEISNFSMKKFEKKLAVEQAICPIHNRPIEGFCETDKHLLCVQCVFEEHKNHDIYTQGKASDRHLKKCETLKNHSENMAEIVENKLYRLKIFQDEATNNFEKYNIRIKSVFDQFKQIQSFKQKSLEENLESKFLMLHKESNDYKFELEAIETKSKQVREDVLKLTKKSAKERLESWCANWDRFEEIDQCNVPDKELLQIQFDGSDVIEKIEALGREISDNGWVIKSPTGSGNGDKIYKRKNGGPGSNQNRCNSYSNNQQNDKKGNCGNNENNGTKRVRGEGKNRGSVLANGNEFSVSRRREGGRGKNGVNARSTIKRSKVDNQNINHYTSCNGKQEKQQHAKFSREPLVEKKNYMSNCSYKDGMTTPQNKPSFYKAEGYADTVSLSSLGGQEAYGYQNIQECYYSNHVDGNMMNGAVYQQNLNGFLPKNNKENCLFDIEHLKKEKLSMDASSILTLKKPSDANIGKENFENCMKQRNNFSSNLIEDLSKLESPLKLSEGFAIQTPKGEDFEINISEKNCQNDRSQSMKYGYKDQKNELVNNGNSMIELDIERKADFSKFIKKDLKNNHDNKNIAISDVFDPNEESIEKTDDEHEKGQIFNRKEIRENTLQPIYSQEQPTYSPKSTKEILESSQENITSDVFQNVRTSQLFSLPTPQASTSPFTPSDPKPIQTQTTNRSILFHKNYSTKYNSSIYSCFELKHSPSPSISNSPLPISTVPNQIKKAIQKNDTETILITLTEIFLFNCITQNCSKVPISKQTSTILSELTNVQCVYYNGLLYLACGTYVTETENLGELSDQFSSIDLRTGELTPLKPLMQSRENFALLVTEDGYIYAIGGRNQETVSSLVERYNISEKNWEVMDSLQFAKGNCAGFVTKSNIYVYDFENRKSCVERYDLLKNAWEAESDMVMRGDFYGRVCGESCGIEKILAFELEGIDNNDDQVGFQYFEFVESGNEWIKRESVFEYGKEAIVFYNSC